ncbi:MAG: acyl carrier protein [Verrucomicrobia bacterium]|nr:acyl carrier protein [Verrucomicrobiota bacterium]
MDQFLKHIAGILEVDNVHESDELVSFSQLDSMGVLSIIAMLDATYAVNISTAEFGQMKTAGELWKFVQCASLKNGRL